MKKIYFLLSSSLVFFPLLSIAAQDVIIYEGDQLNYDIIHGQPTEDSTLYFGDTLEHFLKWDAARNMFVFSDNVDFGGNQLVNARIENLATAPVCDGDSSGRLYINTTNNFSYVCNGTTWKQIDEEAQNPAPYIKTLTPSKFSVGTTTTVTVSGGNFATGLTASIPNFHGTLGPVTVDSPTSISFTVTPASGDTGIYDLVLSDGNTSNTAWSGNGVGLLQVESILVPGSGSALWVRTSGVTTAVGEILPSSTANGWNKGGSFGTVPANTDFRLSFQPKYMAGYSTNGNAMIGMDSSDPDTNYITVDYGLYLGNGSLYIYENGTFRGSFGSYTTSDTLGIQRRGTSIEYYKNGTKFYTSSTPSSSSLVFDTSLYQYLGATNIKVVY